MVHCLVYAYTVCVGYVTTLKWLSSPPVGCELYPILPITNITVSRLWAVTVLAILLRDTLCWVCMSVCFICSLWSTFSICNWSSSFSFKTDFFSRSCCFLMTLWCWTSYPSISSSTYIRNRMSLGALWLLYWLWSPLVSWYGSLNKLHLIFLNNTDGIFS